MQDANDNVVAQSLSSDQDEPDPLSGTVLAELNDLRRAFRSGQLKEVGQGQAKATLIQDDGGLYPLPGKLLFTDITVDPGTGRVILRSEFPNPDLDLPPGSFVRVRLEQAVNQQGISVPQRAIQRDSAGIAQVLLLDAEQRVSQQPVELGAGAERPLGCHGRFEARRPHRHRRPATRPSRRKSAG